MTHTDPPKEALEILEGIKRRLVLLDLKYDEVDSEYRELRHLWHSLPASVRDRHRDVDFDEDDDSDEL